MDAGTFIDRIRGNDFFEQQTSHIEVIPAREARYADLQDGLHPGVEQALRAQGIERLYTHQAEAIEHIRAGRNVVIVTGTASGKTLCYNIPVIETMLDDPMATALYIYPTKALAQDQLRGLGRLETDEMAEWFMAGTYDGDTPSNLRRRLRDGGNVLLTNPDMLHQGILPHHARWNRFFTHLRHVVIDEVHAYRGVFGSHLANVMRRLQRICRHYGAQPQFVCCSATIGNPREHAERITGVPMEPVDDDGSPRGPRRFVLWNPRPLSTAARGSGENWRVGGDRRSALSEAIDLMTELVREEVQTIAFVRTRLAAELLFKGVRDRLRPISRRLSQSVHAYRGGYLPAERREIERRLVEREILGVASTNALELGIDIGSLDACILVGYPGTVASTWQMSGRAGRGEEEALVFLVGQNTPMDQYLMAHSGYLFDQSPEQAVVDPDNPHITIGHLRCAAYELPLADEEAPRFGPYSDVVLELLEEEQLVRHLQGHWYWASSEYPAAEVNLRNISGPVYTIQDERDGERVIGTLDEVSALSQLHDHAVYIHGAETYFVEELDIDQKIAHVDRRDLDYYTQSVQSSQIRIEEVEDERGWMDGLLGFGDVTVTTEIPMFKKIKFASRDSLGWEKLELPPQQLETVAMWFAPREDVAEELTRRKMIVGEALIGIANVFVEVAPLYVMADVQDIGTVVDSSNLGRDALFVHDRYPGGMGFAARCMERFDDIMRTVARVIEECACEDGCPSCVGSAIPPFAATDMDTAVRGRIPDKAAARALIRRMIEGGGGVPRS
ncbi:MAG: DEAD/DEAH box helicase [Armatimonadota bacterium]|jgi:DEAD/DEAH box helicase domain-containing protein